MTARARSRPLGLPAFRSGDLLARLVHDVDSLQDLLLRVVPTVRDRRCSSAAATVGAGLVDAPRRRPDPARRAAARRRRSCPG